MCSRRTSERFRVPREIQWRLEMARGPERGAARSRRARWVLEDEFDDFLGDEVREAKIEAGDRHEAQDDGGRLRDLATIRPLHALELRPAGAEKGDRAIAAARRGAGGPGRPAVGVAAVATAAA